MPCEREGDAAQLPTVRCAAIRSCRMGGGRPERGCGGGHRRGRGRGWGRRRRGAAPVAASQQRRGSGTHTGSPIWRLVRWQGTGVSESTVRPPPSRGTMKDRRHCAWRWWAFRKQNSNGAGTYYKGCDVATSTLRIKPALKTMTTRTPTVVCASHWWAAQLTIDSSTDSHDCNSLWVDKKCTCKPIDRSLGWE